MPDTQIRIGADNIPGPVGLVGLGLIGLNVYGLFHWTWIAALALGYAILCVLIWTVPFLKPVNEKWQTVLGHVSLAISAVAALMFSTLVAFHYMRFKTAAWIILVLFSLAVVFFSAGDLSRLRFIFLNSLIAVLLAIFVQQLPPPPGSLELRAKFLITPRSSSCRSQTKVILCLLRWRCM